MPHRGLRALRTSHLLAVAVATLSLPACSLSFSCGTVSQTIADGTARDAAGVALATVQGSVSEYVGPSFLRLAVGVVGSAGSGGAPLRGHLTRARLVTESGDVLAEIPTGTSTLFSDAVAALNLDLSSRTEFDRIRSALLTNRTKVVLDTDLPGREHIETTLSGAREEPGKVSRCSPA